MRCVVLTTLLLVATLAEAAVRSDGHWQSLQLPSGADKMPTTTTTPITSTTTTTTTTTLPPRRLPPYLEAALFRKAPAPTTTTTTTTTTTPEPDAEVMVMPARFPPVWRPSLLGEELVGALIRHTATDEFDRSHGRYVDSFIHGQPLGFF